MGVKTLRLVTMHARSFWHLFVGRPPPWAKQMASAGRHGVMPLHLHSICSFTLPGRVAQELNRHLWQDFISTDASYPSFYVVLWLMRGVMQSVFSVTNNIMSYAKTPTLPSDNLQMSCQFSDLLLVSFCKLKIRRKQFSNGIGVPSACGR